MKRYALAGYLALALCQLAPVMAEPILLDHVVAVVNQDVILNSQVQRFMDKIQRSAASSGQSLPPPETLKKQVIERLIQESLQWQLAQRQGMKLDDTQLDKAIQNIAKEQAMTLAQLKTAVTQDGLTYPEYREEVEREIIMGELRRNQIRRRISISKQELKPAIEYLTTQGKEQSQYHIGQIQISLPENPGAAELKQAQAKAKRILAQLEQGADFRQLALAESDGPRALDGGDWGYMTLQEMPTLMAETLKNATIGETKGPVRSGAGLHIMRLFDVKNALTAEVTEIKARHILLKPSLILSDAKAEQILKGYLADIKAGKADFATLAEKHSEDPGSAVQGGDLGWANPDSFVPAFKDTILRLQNNDYSEPFRSDFGWHIVQVLDKRIQNTSTEALEQRAYQLIYNRRFTEEVQSWLDELRSEAYIRIEDK